jgi:deoxyadenosine/deoxycytidine kinase
MSRQVVLHEDEVRAFASLLSRISQRLDTYEQQTHEDRQYAQELQATADDLLHRLEAAAAG